jgi:hypothetical protein
MKINMNTLTNEMAEPTDETIFHTKTHTNSYEVSLELTVLSFIYLFSFLVCRYNLVNFYYFQMYSVRWVGGLLVCLICTWRSKLKSRTAYTSVAHMGVTGGMITLGCWGICDSFI